MLNMLRYRFRIFAGCLLIAAATSAKAAGLLLGSGTLDAPGDLTRVQIGSNTLEFLDLTATVGQTVEAAVAAYSSRGFHWANGTEVSDLFSAFGIIYAIRPNAVVDLGASPASRASFVSYLGSTTPSISLSDGYINDLVGGGFYTYGVICGGSTGCSPLSFVNNTDNSTWWPSLSIAGTFLARVSPVPEPSSAVLLVLGATGVFGIRRLRRRQVKI